MSKQINIGGRIHSTEVGNVTTGANEVLDDTKGKKQNVINADVDAELLRLDQSKQNNLTFDNTPTENSNNPVKSSGVYAADKALSDAIEAILLLIPSAATALNQLADKAFVNSSVSTATATFRGTYNVVTDLELAYDATHEQIATKLGQVIATADNNDYAFVQVPVSATSTDIRRTERYKFNGTVWGYEYDLNTSGFTQAQWEAINSGITALLVSKLTNLPTAEVLATMFAAKQNVLTFDAAPTALSTNPVYSGGVYAAIKAITDLIPEEATNLNQLADKAYVLASILAATPAFKGQFTSLVDLQAVSSPKAGDLGIVRTKDNDGKDVFTFYQYLNNQWNVYFSLSYHPQTKPATTGNTGDYPYNGMGRVELPMNIVEGVNTLTQSMMPIATGGNTNYIIRYDFTLGEDITVPANCVLEFDGGSINGNSNTVIYQNTKILGNFKATNFVASGTLNHEVLNILYYGAVDINDHGSDDSYQAIQNAIYAGQKQRKEVYVPKGYFKVTQTLTLDPNEMQILILKGAGRRFSTLASFVGGSNPPLILLTHNVSENKNTVQNTQISDMTLINAGDSSAVGISINRASGTIIRNLDIRSFRQGINAILSWCFTIEKCSFYNFADGWDTCGIYLNRQCNATVIRECGISLSTAPSRTCVRIFDESANITFSKCNFEYGSGINIIGTYQANAPLTNVTFEECYFEWMTSSCLYISTDTANRVKDILLLNCYFNAIEDGTNQKAIVLGVSDNVSIINCEFTRFTNSCIDNNNACNNLLIVNCSRDENLTLLLHPYYTHTIIDKGMPIAKMVNWTTDLPGFASLLSAENKGLLVFDGQANKPVWYDGNGGWVDATGATV